MHSPQEHTPTQEDCANQMDCEPCSTSITALVTPSRNDDYELLTASNTLEVLAREKGFVIHDVPGDANCLFNSVAYQFESVSTSKMREIVANHVDKNSAFYRHFLAQPVESSSAYNADTVRKMQLLTQ